MVIGPAGIGNRNRPWQSKPKLKQGMWIGLFAARRATAIAAVVFGTTMLVQTLAATAVTRTQSVSEDPSKKLRHEFGFSFLVYRDKVQEELKLTPAQKEKLDAHLKAILPDTTSFFERQKTLKYEQQQIEFEPYRQKALNDLDAVLQETLTSDQRLRLQELERQREGLFGGRGILQELGVTKEQRIKFMAAIQPSQRKIQALLMEALRSGHPDDIRPKVLKIRAELETKMETVLTDEQRKLWKQMLGKPMPLESLFDM